MVPEIGAAKKVRLVIAIEALTESQNEEDIPQRSYQQFLRYGRLIELENDHSGARN